MEIEQLEWKGGFFSLSMYDSSVKSCKLVNEKVEQHKKPSAATASLAVGGPESLPILFTLL